MCVSTVSTKTQRNGVVGQTSAKGFWKTRLVCAQECTVSRAVKIKRGRVVTLAQNTPM